ncbi:ketohexokinase-like [Eupeodes corollae]|uniref:ketohexokinase-like n=1 Tax=Eupeodes corollae TaxID=290404 RepID=UPI002490E356|nr:ketohexokinase-like [Eupeodes corollae]
MDKNEINENNNSSRILCVGMCVLDIVHVCSKFPEEDTDRRCLKGYWQRGGNASNNCTVLRNLNADCEFLGMLSESQAFGFLNDDCRKRGIRIENCPITPQDPPFSSVVLSQESDSRTIIHSNSNFPILKFEHFDRVDLAAYSWIHFEGRNPEETLQMMQKIHDSNRRTQGQSIKISVELEKLKGELFDLVGQSDYVFLGKELALFMGWQSGQEALDGVQKMCPNPKEGIICTWGSKGSFCLNEAGDLHHIEPCPPAGKIVDALGAGDTYCAAVIYGLDRMKLSLEKAVELGNRVAGFKLGHCGYDAIREIEPEKMLKIN